MTPVNRAGSVVSSTPAARSLAELEVVPELVIISAAGDELLEFAAEAASACARALVLLSESPEDGSVASPERGERLLEIVLGAGLRMVGPGSLGVINTAADVRLNATFSGASVHAGGLAIGSQAAGLGIGLLGQAEARQLGVSVLVSLGSPADVSTNDLLEWCEEDDRTAVVMLYVEAFGDPEHFIPDRAAGVAHEAGSCGQGASQRPAGARRSALPHGRGVARGYGCYALFGIAQPGGLF